MIRPSSSLALVLALNCLQNSMMLICAWPNAGPTGGAGVALPAAICNFTEPVIFFAIIVLLKRASARLLINFLLLTPRRRSERVSCSPGLPTRQESRACAIQALPYLQLQPSPRCRPR